MHLKIGFPKPVIQWVVSFVILDLVFFAYYFVSCISSPNLCYGANSYLVYYFYGFALQIIDLLGGSKSEWAAQVTNAPIIGMFVHVLLGAVVGYHNRHIIMSWSRTISAAVSVLLLVSFVPALLFSVIGMLYLH